MKRIKQAYMGPYGASSLRLPCQTPQTERPECQEFTSSELWRLGAKDQGVGGVVPSEDSLLGLWVAVFTWLSLCAYLGPSLF